jgi:hypothetical protein
LKLGQISPQEWADRFDSILLEGHTQAWRLGRQRSGDGSPQTLDDYLHGLSAKDQEADWLESFMEKIDAGGFTDENGVLRTGPIMSRSRLYVGKMRGTANEAFVELSPDSSEWWWILGVEDHCDDCPFIAGESPFTKDANIGYPGDGGTECLGNCGCHIRRDDGIECFTRTY